MRLIGKKPPPQRVFSGGHSFPGSIGKEVKGDRTLEGGEFHGNTQQRFRENHREKGGIQSLVGVYTNGQCLSPTPNKREKGGKQNHGVSIERGDDSLRGGSSSDLGV